MPRPRGRETFADLGLLACLYALFSLLCQPWGDFPLNDDWAYGLAARNLLEQGRLVYPGWVSMSLTFQVFWGALFAKLFGFSFGALRLSTLCLGLAGVCAAYGCAERLGLSRGQRLWLAGLVAVNPLYFSLSQTFMTDVPFTALTLCSLYFFLRGAYSGKLSDFALCAAFGLCCLLVRQLGLALFIGYLAFGLAERRKSLILYSVGLIGLGVFALYLNNLGTGFSSDGPVLALKKEAEFYYNLLRFPLATAARYAELGVASLIYCGLFLFPLALLSLPGLWQGLSARGRKLFWLAGLAGGALFGWYAHTANYMPLLWNVMRDSGLGPVRLRDVAVLGLNHPGQAPAWLWPLATLLGIAGAVAIGAGLVRQIRLAFKGSGISALIIAAGAAYLAPLAGVDFFDRYTLFFLPLAGLSLCLVSGRLSGAWQHRLPAIAVALALAWFSLAGTHDYLALNRARWQGLEQLTQGLGVSPLRIDGGFEFNGLYTYGAEPEPDAFADGGPPSWWWVRRADYLVALGPVPGYRTCMELSYPRWLSLGPGRVCMLKAGPGDGSK